MSQIAMVAALGLPAALEQTAEEAVELAHACLKLSRVLRCENPTLVTQKEAEAHLAEELVDMEICLRELEYLYWDNDLWKAKNGRLQNRLQEKEAADHGKQ